MTGKPLDGHRDVSFLVRGLDSCVIAAWAAVCIDGKSASTECRIVTFSGADLCSTPTRPMAMRENRPMPLPNAPTRRPNNPTTRQADRKANSDLLIKGILCVLIGLGVLVSPHFITSTGMQGIVAKASLVGWFALVLGCAFLGLYLKRRMTAASKP
jgi:hypothetical protein